MRLVEKINNILKKIGIFLSSLAILFIMLLIVTDVILRNIFESPISGVYEVIEVFLMPLAILPALSYTYGSGIMPRLTELIEKVPKSLETINKYFIYLLELTIFSLLTLYSFKFALLGVEERTAIPISGEIISIYPIYFLVPLAFFNVLLEIIVEVYYSVMPKDN